MKKAAPPRRRGLRFTREGRLFVFVTTGVGAAAVNTGNNLLYLMLGLMLSLIVLSGMLSDLVLWGVEINRRLPSRAVARTPCVLELSVRNTKRLLPSYSVELTDRSGQGEIPRRCYFLKISAGGTESASYELLPSERGVLELQGFRLSTRYPFGLFEKWRIIDHQDELLVYPQPLPFPFQMPRERGREQAELAPARSIFGEEPAGLREHRPFEDARAIHWRRSLSLGRTVARERERARSTRLSIVIDDSGNTSHPPVRADDDFEELVSRAAFAVERANSHGAAIDIISRNGRSMLLSSGSSADPLLAFLARLAPASESSASLPMPQGPFVLLRRKGA